MIIQLEGATAENLAAAKRRLEAIAIELRRRYEWLRRCAACAGQPRGRATHH
jgi:hypothetical protein